MVERLVRCHRVRVRWELHEPLVNNRVLVRPERHEVSQPHLVATGTVEADEFDERILRPCSLKRMAPVLGEITAE